MRRQIMQVMHDGLLNRVMIFVMLFGMVIAVSGRINTTAAGNESITVHVSASSDDARSMDDNRYSHTERTALIGAGNGSRANVSGIRFTGLSIPRGATITSVEFSMVKNKSEWIRMVMDCGFEATDNARAFSKSWAPGARPMTASKARSDTNIRRNSGQRYVLCDTGALAAALQEVVNRPGWQPGNSVALLLNGPANPAWARMSFFTRDGGAQMAPRLVVNYSTQDTPKPPSIPTATATTSPTATATTQPTATATTAPTATPGGGGHDHDHDPDPNPGPDSREFGTWKPGPQDTCTVEEHNSYSVIGPDGKRYSTWHAPTHTRSDGSVCSFGHEHGHDPRLSAVTQTMPPFGYAAEQIGMVEPHVGFKVFVINRGESFEGKVVEASYRMVFHMGTSGVGRYTNQFHSADYAFSHPNGASFHVMVMADTGNGTGSTCTNPRDGGRDFSTVGCNDPYEIWNSITVEVWHPNDLYRGAMQQRLWASFSMGTFDPITTRDPNDNSRVLYSLNYYEPNSTVDPSSTQSRYRGCDREVYGGPNYLYNQGQSSEYWTDPYGKIVEAGTPGAILQRVSAAQFNDTQIPKLNKPSCHATVHSPN